MKILAIETTGNTAATAVVSDNAVLGEISTNYKKNHSVTILPMVDFLLKTLEFAVNDMDYIAVTQGPGSFTGLRIGAATAKALAHGANKSLIPIPALDALAYNIFEENINIVPIMDARRNEVYYSIYTRENGVLVKLIDYTAAPVLQCLDHVKKLGKHAVFLGDGCFVHADIIRANGYKTAGANNILQRASSVGLLAEQRIDRAVSYNEMELIYLRKPQAEREYDEKLNGE
ncbi:MAG: tRNA (adenosine(37)-N6)-threonylcarbamoyltransferase complex dimerization subunit type 1 TsaB [Clostridiales bacterium]|jgi:tRNA threonylcarbamoyladenosine biosynthesis protein TsaB|nr:tRNA (adenosine(37)-N6)-threonylcarbamoyltransferase complex dimerization subunit type 1 TsaB [Clostridiales bacterium]